jgi:two-component system sensor histidine kinase CpxA
LPDLPKEAFRTDAPRRYWFLVRLPLPNQPRTTLVGMTESLGQSGLLFDPKPWLWTALAVLGVSILLWWPLIHGLTRALSHMTIATDQISRGNFDTRVDERRRDELGRLGGAINRMTGRLGGFVTGQKRFLGDVAHELCAPLARLEMSLGVLEQRAPESLRGRIDDVRDEAREINALVSEILSFSKAGLQSPAPPREAVAVAPVAEAAVAREAAGADVRIDVPDGLCVSGVAPLLQRALANLVRNAVRHAGAAGPIELNAIPRGDSVAITVADRGPGVPPESLPHLFDPFYRVDPSRTRETGGAGLGLAIVKTCAEACGGSVSAENRAGGGFAVTINVPAVSMSDTPAGNQARSSRRGTPEAPNQPTADESIG